MSAYESDPGGSTPPGPQKNYTRRKPAEPERRDQAGFTVEFIRDGDGTIKVGPLRLFANAPICTCCGRSM